MRIFEGLNSVPVASPVEKSVVTIGNFDGVHVGHRSLIQTLVQQSQARGLRSVVMTFDPHPIQVLFPEKKLLKIFDRADQIKQFEELGVQNLVIEPFTKSLAQQSAEFFLRHSIFERFDPQLLIVGYDFSFGANRSGSIPQLLEFAKSWGFELMIIPPHKIGEEIVSSTLIRKTVHDGDMIKAAALLGRPFYVEAKVEHGFKRGKSIGVPTANLKYWGDLILPSGVYVTESTVDGRKFRSVTNVGVNPTVTDTLDIKVETHILDFSEEIYDKVIKVEFLRKLRDEKKFSSLEDLKSQIKLDILSARAYETP